MAEGIKLPKVQRREMHFLTAAQVEALADAIVPPYGVLIRLAAYTGLRPCEFVALKVRRLIKHEPTTTIVVYFSVNASLIGLLTLPLGWVWPSWTELASSCCPGCSAVSASCC